MHASRGGGSHASFPAHFETLGASSEMRVPREQSGSTPTRASWSRSIICGIAISEQEREAAAPEIASSFRLESVVWQGRKCLHCRTEAAALATSDHLTALEARTIMAVSSSAARSSALPDGDVSAKQVAGLHEARTGSDAEPRR